MKLTRTETPKVTGAVRAILSRIDDIGLQPGFQGGPDRHELVLTWQMEKTYERDGVSRPLVHSERVTPSLHPKSKLSAITEGMIGRKINNNEEFDIDGLVGRSCILTLAEDDKGHSKAKSTAPLMPGMVPLKMVDMPCPDWIQELKTGQNGQAGYVATDPSTPITPEDMDRIIGATTPVTDKDGNITWKV